MRVPLKKCEAPEVALRGDAGDEAIGRSILTPDLTRTRQHTPSLPRAIYDPRGVRRCPTCARCDGWRRWAGQNAGGWYCCTAPQAVRVDHAALTHYCTRSCLLPLGGVA